MGKHRVFWDDKTVQDFIIQNGRGFARFKTPHGLRTMAKQITGFNKLEGKCFANCLVLAKRLPDTFWYCEGYALGASKEDKKVMWMPHAWLMPKKYDEDWALDVTWKWDSYDSRPYFGIRFDGNFALDTMQALKKKRSEEVYVPRSLLSYPEILNKELDGFGNLYCV